MNFEIDIAGNGVGFPAHGLPTGIVSALKALGADSGAITDMTQFVMVQDPAAVAKPVPVALVSESLVAALQVAARDLQGSDSCVTTSTVLCLKDGRFAVSETFTTGTRSGLATGVQLTADTGYFWFFSPSNVETVIKVLDGCALSKTFWVFAGGLTNVDTIIRVVDTETGQVKTYHNPQGTAFQPVQDTSAFTTCVALGAM